MNLVRQTIRIFSSKILINLLILMLLAGLALTIEGATYDFNAIPSYFTAEIEFEDADNLLHVQHANMADNTPLDLTDLSFSPSIHSVGSTNFKTADNYMLSIVVYDEKLMSLNRFELIDGRMPRADSEAIEFICPEGAYALYEEIDIVHETFKKAVVVGICSKEDRVIELDLSSTDKMKSSDLFSRVYSEIGLGDSYTLFTFARQDIKTYPPKKVLIEYDADVYRENRTTIINELSGRGFNYSSLGEEYKQELVKYKEDRVTNFLVILAFGIPALILLLLCYHNLLSVKANTLGTYYLLGYSKKKISIMMALLSLIYLILFVPILIIFYKIVSGNMHLSYYTFFVCFGIAAAFNAVGLAYILLLLGRTKVISLIKQEGEK